MACEHRRLKSVNCVLYCMDCGARIDPPEGVNMDREEERATRASGRKIRFNAEKPKRRARKGATEK